MVVILNYSGSFNCGGHRIGLWSAYSRRLMRDLSVSLKVLLRPMIPWSCWHLRGGVKSCVRMMSRELVVSNFVGRFDIRHYYESMDHNVLLSQLVDAGVSDKDCDVVRCYLTLPLTKRSVNHGGVGMTAGGSLAPLMGALYLSPLDRVMVDLRQRGKIRGYHRYMDDIVILTKTRWQLRKAIKIMHGVLADLKLTCHGDRKRFIGRVTCAFDFLGYEFRRDRLLRPSKVSIDRFRKRMISLMSKEPDRLWLYVERWWITLHAGLRRMIARNGGLRRLKKRASYFLKQNGFTIPSDFNLDL